MEIIYGFSVDEALVEATGQIGNILAGLERESARLGKDRLAALLRPEAEQISLFSDKLRLSGKIDRICMPDGRQLPVCVSASAPPENGIYLSDRVKLAAYSLLVSDAYGCEVTRCAMEYMGGWCIREVEIRKADMREALSIRRRIEEGRTAMPDARRSRWCNRCEFKSSCVARVSFLDSLYKQVFQ
jgi:CRISPR-associated exonuclease Cas4